MRVWQGLASIWTSLMILCLGLGCGEQSGMAVSSIDPDVGPLRGRHPVRVHGQNFRSDIGYTVLFGNRKADSVTILDQSTLMVTPPESPWAGQVDVTVRTDTGASFRIEKGFRYAELSSSIVEKLGEAEHSGKGSLVY